MPIELLTWLATALLSAAGKALIARGITAAWQRIVRPRVAGNGYFTITVSQKGT